MRAPAPDRRLRGFTLLEAVVALAVVTVLAQGAAFAYTAARDSQVGTAARPLLAAAQVEGRRVAAGSGYLFPTDLLTHVNDRAPADGGFRYSAQPSYAPGTARNIGDRYVISVASDGASRAAYAVETSSEDGTGDCWVIVDDVDPRDRPATGWGYSAQVAYGDCSAAAALGCASTVTGTATEPSDVATLTGCIPDPPG